MRHRGRESLADHTHEHAPRRNERCEVALQPSRRADPDQVTHDEPEIEATRMNQDALENVCVSAQMRSPHPTRVIEVRERAFDRLGASTHQAPSTGTTNRATIAIHRRLRVGGLRSIASSAIRLGDVERMSTASRSTIV